MEFSGKQRIISLLFAWVILVATISPSQCKSLRSSAGGGRDKESKRRHTESELEGGNTDLIRLIEVDASLEITDDSQSNVSKRVIRSPMDEDIDDTEDSQEDEDDEDDEKEKPKKKKDKDVGVAGSTQAPTSLQLSKPSLPQTLTTIAKPVGHITATPSPSSTSVIHGTSKPTVRTQGNGTVMALPPGFRQPPGAFFPGGKPPPGGLPFPGKLPPNLLKHISAPKPPPRKGELYLPEDYNNLVIPKLNLGKIIGIDSYIAVPVLVFLNIRSVRDIDEELEMLTLDLDLVIEWVDGFLFDPISAAKTRKADITLNPIFLKKIWRPDIYIDEIVKVKRTSLMNKPLKLKFNPSNGFISYTTRLAVQLSCDMIYKYYPADTHHCEFTFRSYSYFSKDLDLSWLGTGVYLQDPQDPNFDLQVESIGRVKLPQTFRKLTNDTYDGLTFTILARRKLSFHLVQTYLPSIFFIVITWLCFLVPARMVEARIGISMTTLLTLTSMFASVRESTPIVSYVKAIDIWIVSCIFFVFMTLLEFATLVWLRSRRETAEEQKLELQRKIQADGPTSGEKETNGGATFSRSLSLESTKLRKYETFAELTEKYAFLIFSIVFLLFNIIYWSWLLSASDYFNWSVNSTLNAEQD